MDDATVVRLLAEMVDLGVGEVIVANLFHVMAENLRKMAKAAPSVSACDQGLRRPANG